MSMLNKTQTKELFKNIQDTFAEAAKDLSPEARAKLEAAFTAKADALLKETGGFNAPGSYNEVTIRILREFARTMEG